MTFDKKIAELKKEFLRKSDSKGSYWSLHKGSTLLSSNHEEGDPEDSFQLLIDAIKFNWSEGHGITKFIIKQKSGEKDSKPLNLPLLLPVSNEGSGIGSTGGSKSELFDLYKMKCDLESAFFKERIELESKVAQAQADNAKSVDRVLDRVESWVDRIFNSEIGKSFIEKTGSGFFGGNKIEGSAQTDPDQVLKKLGYESESDLIADFKNYAIIEPSKAKMAIKMVKTSLQHNQKS